MPVNPPGRSVVSRPTDPSLIRESAAVVTAALVSRAAFIWFKGLDSYSFDLWAWKLSGDLLRAGHNPYLSTDFFAWPPLWVQIVFLLQRCSDWMHVSLLVTVPIFLIAIETVLIVLLLKVLRALRYERRRTLVLFGIALNPVCIILVTQHGNFDVLVGLLVLLSVSSLVRFQSSTLPEDWLLAAFWLGLGALLKSVPIVLVPLLLSGSRALSGRVRGLGACLAFGPAAYGLSVLHVLGAGDVSRILGYQSSPFWFGVTGWFHLMDRDSWAGPYRLVFVGTLALAGMAVAVLAYRGHLARPQRLVASAGLLLMLIPALGPGYVPQYFYWFWPLLLLSFALGPSRVRKLVLGFGLIAALTYGIEYAFADVLGAYLNMRFPLTENLLFGEAPAFLRVFTLVRAPLWLGYLLLLLGLVGEVRGSFEESSGKVPSHAGHVEGDVLPPSPA